MPNYNTTLQTNNSSLEEIITQLNNLPNAGGNPVLQNKTVTPAAIQQTVVADEGYDGLDTVTVSAMPTATQATPAITLNNATGLITATATQTAGYVTAGTKSATKQLAFQAAKTITPGTTNQTAVAANTYVGGAITVKGDANLVASNIVSGKSIFGVVGTATTGGGGGDTTMEDGLIMRTGTTYVNDRVTSIGSYVFYQCSRLTSVNFPMVNTIGGSAFYQCLSLTSVNFPNAITIDTRVFYNCSSLTSISFPMLSTIGSNAFYYCTRLTSVSFPNAITISNNVFYQCSRLTSISFPKVTTIGSNAFYQCPSLTSISFPKVTTIGSNAFAYCSSLSKIYLGAPTLCSLSNSNAFSYTGIGSNKGSIFVPTSLVATYKSATNWAYFKNRIFGF
jgi:hypothetical protein